MNWRFLIAVVLFAIAAVSASLTPVLAIAFGVAAFGVLIWTVRDPCYKRIAVVAEGKRDTEFAHYGRAVPWLMATASSLVILAAGAFACTWVVNAGDLSKWLSQREPPRIPGNEARPYGDQIAVLSILLAVVLVLFAWRIRRAKKRLPRG